MSIVSDEEYTRVHSHIEFLVDPERLVSHVRIPFAPICPCKRRFFADPIFHSDFPCSSLSVSSSARS